jgi:hypothetical protein
MLPPSKLHPHLAEVTTTEVECETLQTFLDRHNITRVDFLKMDAEGAEYEVFINLNPSILSRIQRMDLELHRPASGEVPDMLIEYLRKRGYSMTNSITNSRNLFHFRQAPA